MRFLIATIFTAFLLVYGLVNTAQAQSVDPACGYTSNFVATRGVYYMSCFLRGNGQTDDTLRIQFAVDFIVSGKLIFDERNYTVTGPINLHSYLILEGAGTGTTYIPSPSQITLTSSGSKTTPKGIFKIGESVYDVTIKDLGLQAAPLTNYTYGILGQGAYPAASLNFEFSNLRFTGLTTGIKVQATDSLKSFQFDNVKLEHCTFENCATGIHINSFNSGWQINSIEFYAGAGAVGLYMERGTYTTIDSMIGNGVFTNPAPPAVPEPLSDSLIILKERASAITIRNCVTEGFINDIKVDGNNLTAPIHLTGNFFQGLVEVKNATLLSTGNQFGITVGNYVAPQPIINGRTQLYSIGDKFCSEGAPNCVTGGYVAQEDAVILFGSSQLKNTTIVPTFMNHYLNIESALANEPLNRPMLSIFTPTSLGRPLLKLGQADLSDALIPRNYILSINPNNNWLNFTAQAGQNTGYKFDGPVKLPSFEAALLPPVIEEGSMVFCRLCLPGSNPCTSGGAGALAVSIGSAWVCK
jgi:hypothetical protein